MTHRTAQELVTPRRLRAFFAPESIALVGASDNSGWARFIVASCAAAGFAGPLTAVHPRARTAFGLPVVPSLRDLPTPADLAFILTPAHAVEGVLDDIGVAGIPNAVVLASGYREIGQDGRALEELLTTGAALAYHRWPRGRRMGVLTASGGSCDIIADAAGAHGLQIPAFAPRTAAITRHLPPFADAQNPLDVTGFGALANLSARTSPLTALGHALDIAVEDPNLDFILFAGLTLPEARPPDEAMASMIEGRLDWLAGRMASSPIPVIPVAATCVNVSGYGRELLTARGLSMLGGLNLGVSVLGHALRWLENRGRVRPAGPAASRPALARAVPAPGPWSEAAARRLLAAAGVPVVPGALAGSAEAAVAIARQVGLPVAVKICSAQITHKSDIGGVVLGLGSAAEVRAGYEKARAAGEAVPGASIDGVLVTPMRSGGTELLAGVTVDATFGPVLAVGLGGIWTEILRDTSLRLLPVDAAEVKRMLAELRGWPLLRGARGTQPADLDAVAEAIAGMGDAALSLNGTLRALEVNPLWVNGDQVEALDVLVITGPERAKGGAAPPGLRSEERATREGGA